MARILNVYALPSLVEPGELAGGTAVVIDVLRTSTTIVHALEAGAKEVIFCLEIDEARAIAAQLPADEVVLAGERNGLPIDGFDLGNSPHEFTPYHVGGKSIVLSTTNGTRAIAVSGQAKRVLIGAFVNATAVYQQLLHEEQIHLVCAGTAGQYSRDDVLMAGLLVERLQRLSGMIYEVNAQATTARENWLASFTVPAALGAEPLDVTRLAGELQKSLGGQNLVAVGLADDILAAAQVDQFAGVPEVVPGQMRIRLP